MVKLWLLFVTLAFSCLFLIYRPDGSVTFLLSGISSPKDTAAYFTYEHIIMIIMASLLVWPPTEHKYMYKLFLLLTGMDMVFFLLYYKSPPLWNPLKCAIFGVPLLYETWKNLQQRYRNT